MNEAITRQFPGEAIRWTILSHNHLDHIRGSALLGAREVIGHKDVDTLVADWPDTGKGIATVTRTIEGDQTLTLGGIEVQALYMPYSHSHTLYGFFVPAAGVVYAPDMMFVKAVPPYDFPDFYYPGYIRALDRLIALNAAHYVPSHAWRGTRADMVDYRNMAVDFQTTVKEELLARGIESATDGPAVQEALRAAYDRLEPKYGKWHGFNEMFVPKYGRHVGGTYLGY
jgi:glyoxylase-like metal-dependent hydrolase (beta-lactamase superfamily II)